ncbi:restriction endonuclease subunit S [Tessaracoccus defluvii]|uniref:Restriction endonuclease subunit S n=1 Tax=Tessaracoccus defluvii TaxID=1285901 RepID=A0A7H0H5Q2_9ACTN|nr:hypothetical protein [Tessaracoccus defluvii]QNP55868.1 hypothetical protein H9L22_17460 [Tessaracoccus defluvii]
MREGWDRLQFHDVVTLDVRKTSVLDGKEYPIVGVLAYGRGLLYRDPVSRASTSYRELNSIRPNQLIFSKLKAFEGAITVAPGDLAESYASSEFPTFTATARVLPAFLRLMTQRSELWKAMAANSRGLGGRRERLNPIDFLAMSASFPPLPEQQRIVDLMGTLDDTIAAAELRLQAAVDQLRSLRALTFAAGKFTTGRDAFDILIGVQRNPTRAGGARQIRYLRSANVTFGRLNLSDVYEMSFSPQEQAKYSLIPGDVLVSEGSASEAAVGAPCRWIGELEGPVCFQNTLLRYRARPHVSSPSFVDHWCAWAYESGHFREVAGGSNIKHIGARRAEQMQVRLLPFDDQETAMAPLDAAGDIVRMAQDHVATLAQVRSAILAALLTGEHEIPESYDELMGVAS